jgi:hypothetical protein
MGEVNQYFLTPIYNEYEENDKKYKYFIDNKVNNDSLQNVRNELNSQLNKEYMLLIIWFIITLFVLCVTIITLLNETNMNKYGLFVIFIFICYVFYYFIKNIFK